MFDRYAGKDNYGKPKSEFIENLKTLDDTKLFEAAKDKIWLSAYANNNPRSDYHWHADAIYDECRRRDKVEIYQRAYDYHTK